MNTPSQNIVPITGSVMLPEPGYPMLTRMLSNVLFPDMPPGSCSWKLDGVHPLVPEMKVVRMFVVDGGVHVYSAPSNGVCTRNFVPMGWIRLIQEVMPLEVFVEQLSQTVIKPGTPMISRLVSNSVSSAPSEDEPIVWTVGQSNPFAPTGNDNMKVLRILVEEDVVEIYSSDGNDGMRHFIPIGQMRFSEEAMVPTLFAREMEIAESGEDEDEEEEEEEETDPENPENPPEPGSTPNVTPSNGQQTNPS
jgi:hypothetical protein